MLDLLYSKRWPIALDIGTDSVKMLQMHCVAGAVSVRACGRWQFPVSAQTDAGERRKLMIEAVRDMLRTKGFRGRGVISSLSCRQLKIKNIRLPGLSGQKLVQAVHEEAQERFGQEFAPDQLHFLEAGQIRQGMESYQELVLLAAPSEVVEDHCSLLHEMGLRPVHIDAEPLAMFRPFERRLRRQADKEEISIVVDLGHSCTKVVVGRGRDIVLIKRTDIGGKDFAEAVAKELNVSYEEACDLRLQIMRGRASTPTDGAGGPSEQEPDRSSVSWTLLDAVRDKVEELSREIALCLRYCSVTFRGLRPDKVTLTGGQAYDPAMLRVLGEQLGVQCVIGQPLKGINTSGVDLGGDRRGVLAEWGICTGLAFRSAQLERSMRKSSHERDRLSA